ncbi:MAG: NUDIX hydrolase [Anaerolineae bacterium]|nr:NUDIX hydrolase [Anaerolineae bacterium]
MTDTPAPFGPWPVLERHVRYQGRFNIIEERRLTPDGEILWTTVEARWDSVVVLPLWDDGQVTLVRQYRPPLDRVMLELPGGGLVKGGDPVAQARAELAEECGIEASEVIPLTTVVAFSGAVDARIHILLGRGLRRVPSPGRDRHEFIEIVQMPFEEVLQRVVAGELVDVPLVVGVLLARQRGFA